MSTVAILIIILFCLGIIFPRSKFVSFVIIVSIWIFNINISNPDYILLRDAYEGNPYGEIGYRFLCTIFYSLNVDFLVFKMSIVAISLLLLYRFICRYSELPALIMAFYIIICPLDFVQYRNFFAFSILLNAFPLLGSLSGRNIILYLLSVFLGASIHASIIVFIFALLLQKDFITHIKKSKGAIVLMGVVLLPLIYYMISIILDEEVASRSQAYFLNATSLVTKAGVIILCGFVYQYLKKYQHYSEVKFTQSMSTKTWIVYNPNHFVITLSLLFVFLIPVTMFSITFLRLVRFIVLINIVFMTNVRYYTKKGSYLLIFGYSLISLVIGFVLHQETFINEVIMTFLNENLLIR